jgi:hypothetical protein
MSKTSPMERNVSFRSGSLKLSAVLRIPNGMQQGESRPAFVVLHGFAWERTMRRSAGSQPEPAPQTAAIIPQPVEPRVSLERLGVRNSDAM